MRAPRLVSVRRRPRPIGETRSLRRPPWIGVWLVACGRRKTSIRMEIGEAKTCCALNAMYSAKLLVVRDRGGRFDLFVSPFRPRRSESS